MGEDQKGIVVRLVAASALIAAALGGCGDSGSSKGDCSSFCRSFCDQLDMCQIDGSSSCAQACTTGLGSASCADARPPDQLSCGELGALYKCASYCATLCARAPQCGSFDATFCVEGCASQQPFICNQASVAARTCDQLKPELRDYEDVGRSLNRPGDSVSIGASSSIYGLCLSNSDCRGQRCDLTTNVCAPCQMDADCKQDPFGAHICAPDGSCMSVQCAEDTDCFGQKCNPATHQCASCLVDADCGQSLTHCSPTKNTCVQCASDADCAGRPTGSHCGLTSPFESICIQCNTDADCATTGRPHCGTGICM